MIDASEIDDEPGAHELKRMRASFDGRLAWLRRAVFRFAELSEWRLTAEEARAVERMILEVLRPVTVVGR